MPTRVICCCLLAAAGGLIVGCFNKSQPVVPEKAREALRTALDAWKAGASMESLSTGSAEIIAQDIDWMQGQKLISYKVEGDGLPQDANLRVDVELELAGGTGGSTKKRVSYIVGTAPHLTVFRSFD